MKTKNLVEISIVIAGFLVAMGFYKSQLEAKVDAVQTVKICKREIAERAMSQDTGIAMQTDISHIKKSYKSVVLILCI